MNDSTHASRLGTEMGENANRINQDYNATINTKTVVYCQLNIYSPVLTLVLLAY